MAKKKTFENIISNLLGEPVSNLCHAFYDQYVEANVKFRSRAGMKEVIIRRQLGKCCKWCADLAGIYEYGDHPDDIFRRHDNCKCMVTYKDESGYTDVWSKKEFESQKEARETREVELTRKLNDRKAFNERRTEEIIISNDIQNHRYSQESYTSTISVYGDVKDKHNLFKTVFKKTGNKTILEYASSKIPLGNFIAVPADKVVIVLREKSRKWIESLTDYEKSTIRKYTFNSKDGKDNQLYSRINAMLRGELPKDERLVAISDTISKAIRKTRLEYDVICYRSVDIPIYENRTVGEIFKESQFMSTSVRKNGAMKKPFKITVYAKKTTRAAYIEELSVFKKQRELLIDKDTYYRVISKGKNEIKLEVIR